MVGRCTNWPARESYVVRKSNSLFSMSNLIYSKPKHHKHVSFVKFKWTLQCLTEIDHLTCYLPDQNIEKNMVDSNV